MTSSKIPPRKSVTKKNGTTRAHVVFSGNAYRQNTDYYRRFVAIIERSCRLRVLDRWFEKKSPRTPQQIYLESLRAIRNADIVIAETSINSTGVGQQIAYALGQRKPVLICMKIKDHVTSHAFLEGTTSQFLRKIHYHDEHDLRTKLVQETNMLNDATLEKFNFIATRYAKEKLGEESRRLGVSQSQLLRQIIEEWIRRNS